MPRLDFRGKKMRMTLRIAIKPTAWRKFLGGHQFAAHNCAIELEQKRWGAVARALAVAKVAAMART